jgi:hypothetical protein
MLLATLIAKISTSYKFIAIPHFAPGTMTLENSNMQRGGGSVNSGNNPGVRFGTYHALDAQNKKFMELRYLGNELRKLEDVFRKFREVSTNMLSNDADFIKSMIDGLRRTLNSTLEAVDQNLLEENFVAREYT